MADLRISPLRDQTAGVATASALDTARVLVSPVATTIAIGVILRRPWAVALAARLDTDRRGVQQLQRLRDRYGAGLLRLRMPFRRMTLVLGEDDARRVLENAPEPFLPANREKVGALSRFQPHGVLVSPAADRPDRRQFTTTVLETDRPVHSSATRMVAAIGEEARGIADAASLTGLLTWDSFAPGWWRMVRRIVLGDSARDDTETTDLLGRLRKDANWGPVHFDRPAVRARFLARIDEYLARAEPGSLAERAARTPASGRTHPAEQIPQWLFAFDAAGIGVYRALALLATHSAAARRADEEVAGRDLSQPQDLPYLRACLQEAIRLWPTTPAILRDYVAPRTATEGTSIAGLSDGELVLIYAPFFHRDDERLPYADRFTPEIWLDGRAERSPSLVPFSAGAAECPGRNLVLYTTSTMLAQLRSRHRFALTAGAPLDPRRKLPGTLDHVNMRFQVAPRR